MRRIDLLTLLAYRVWRDRFGTDLGGSAFLEHEVPVTHALALSELMFPQVIEVRGCVLRADAYSPENFEQWWETTGGDVAAVE